MLHVLIMLTSTLFAGAGVQSDALLGKPAVAPAPAQFSYDAVDGKSKRKTVAVQIDSEDKLLEQSKRSKLISNSRDIRRNAAIAAWMLRKHLDYVSTFDFHARTADRGFNNALETFIDDWSRPYNCDVAGRHSLPKMLRMGEAHRTMDGDVGLLKLSSGQLQGIEGDRIRDHGELQPKGIPGWVHGVKVSAAGRALAYAIHRRKGMNSYELDKTVAAGNLCLFGYFDRYDQVRGIPLWASALNPLRDVYENIDYALVAAKVRQLFALAFFRKASDAAGELSGGTKTDGSEDKAGYTVNFGGGPFMVDLEDGDDAKFLESQHPPTTFQTFMELVLQVALKSLDLPYSFYDESHTNFFGSRGAWMHYMRSCVDKWADGIELRRRITTWRVMLAVLDGKFELPSGWGIEDVTFEWVPRGMPFWDRSKEVNGVIQEILAGLTTPQRVCRETGSGDFFDNIDQRAIAEKYASEKGVALAFNVQPPAPVVEVNNDG